MVRKKTWFGIARGASWLLGAGLLLAPGAARAQVSEQARLHFEAGVNYLQDPGGARYEEAYLEFKAAYEASPSWKILGNLGLTAMKLERDGEAIAAYEKYLSQGGDELEPDERAQVERDLRTLQASAARLVVAAQPAEARIIDERLPVQGPPVHNQYRVTGGQVELVMRPGRHRLTLSADGFEPQTFEVSLEPAGRESRSIELQPVGAPPPSPSTEVVADRTPPETHRPTPVAVYVGLAATGAFAVGAGVTGVLALGKASDYEEANDGTRADDAEELRSQTQTLNLVTDIFIGAAVIGAGVTTYLYVSRPERPAEHDAALRVTPLAGPTGGGVVLSGTF